MAAQQVGPRLNLIKKCWCWKGGRVCWVTQLTTKDMAPNPPYFLYVQMVMAA